MFLSANLTAGEHQILLKYEPRGLTAGLAFSIISIMCAFSGLLIERRYLRQLDTEKGVQKTVAALQRMGYSFGEIRDALRKVQEDV